MRICDICFLFICAVEKIQNVKAEFGSEQEKNKYLRRIASHRVRFYAHIHTHRSTFPICETSLSQEQVSN